MVVEGRSGFTVLVFATFLVSTRLTSGHPLKLDLTDILTKDGHERQVRQAGGTDHGKKLRDIGAFVEREQTESEPYNGWYNNPDSPDFGGAETSLMRSLPSSYSDGVDSLAGSNRPNPMEISEILSKGDAGQPSYTDKSVLLVFFGEHVVHEIVDTHQPSCPPEYSHIDIPWSRQEDFAGSTQMYFKRSAQDDSEAPHANNPRQQLNLATTWIDGSSIYGTSHSWMSTLRQYSRGRLAFDQDNFNFPELNEEGLPITNPPSPTDSLLKDAKRLYKLGNARSHETPFLLAVGVLMFRWHNYWADLFAQNTYWDDERIFQESRKWVIATYQKIAFYDWLPAFLSLNETDIMMYKYQGYKSYVNPGISHQFQAAAMRFGHSMLPPAVYKRDKFCVFSDLSEEEDSRMCNMYWNSQNITEKVGIEDIILGMASQNAEREDHVVVEDLRTFAYGPHGYSRIDLVATDIQRGRDHGLPDYNTARVSLGLRPVESFSQINSDWDKSSVSEELLLKIQELHDNDLRKLDIWTGGMLEANSEGPGELFRHIILDQFIRIRDGDRFWFENRGNRLFTDEQIGYIRSITLKDIITLTTRIDEKDIQDDVFFYQQGDPCFANSTEWFQDGSRTAKEKNLGECQPLVLFDFFEGTWITLGATVLAVLGWILGVILVVFVLAKRQERRSKREKKLYVRRKSVTRKVTEEETVGTSIVAEEWVGNDTRTVEIRFRKEPRGLRVYDIEEREILRTIDLANQKITIFLSSDNEQRTVLLKVEKEYDLVLIFDHNEYRTLFIQELEQFLEDTNVITGTLDSRDKELRKTAVTKEKREQHLEKFVRAAFVQAFEPDVVMDDTLEPEDREVLSTEMTKTEFADILKLTQDSKFVELMFELADKDKNGTISFREFLDVTVIFAEGKPEDKLEMMFNMYDVDNSERLSRKELEGMLKSLLEMARTSMEQEQVEEAISAMFINSGLENKEELTFDDFKVLMAEHMEQLSNASLKIEGSTLLSPDSDVRRSSLPGSSEARRFSLMPEGRRGSTISSMARRFSLKDGGQSAPPPSPTRKSSRRVSDGKLTIQTIKKQYPRSRLQRKIRSYIAFTENHMSHIFCFLLYIFVLTGLVLYKFYVYTFESEHKGMRTVTGYGLSITRAAAAAQMFTFSTLLVTVSRNFLTKLRETFFSKYIPLDSMLSFHKVVAYMAIVFSVIHTVGHFSNFLHLTTQPAEDVGCLVRASWHRSHELPKFHHWVWATVTGVTGVLLIMVAAIMYTFASQFARRRVFRFFWTAHQLYILFFILCVVHGSARLVQSPDFYQFFLPPAILFTIDKLISVSRKKVEITVLKAEILPSEVTHLEFARPSTFEYKSGQWVRIACVSLGAQEYHPFTLTSAPHEDTLSVHVRAVGPWTTGLRKVYDQEVLQENPLPKIYLDGPYGEGHQDWFKFEVSVLVGAGIGVTPFASILKDIVNNSEKRNQFPCKKVYFVWITRTQKHFEWFTDIIRHVEENDGNMFVDSHIFITQFFQEFDLRTTMLYVCERHFYKASSRSLFTGLRSETHFGRPDFVSFLQSIKDNHPGVHPIGVFSCGPPQMNTGLVSACTALNKVHGKVAFSHHSETF